MGKQHSGDVDSFLTEDGCVGTRILCSIQSATDNRCQPRPQALSSLDCNTLKVSGDELATLPQARLNPHASGALILLLKRSGDAGLSGSRLSARESKSGAAAQRLK